MRVLLVEDDKMIGESLQFALRKSGYSIDWAEDGETAALSLQNQDYDLLLLDLGLPRFSGIELLERLRAKKNAVPVLILTARDSIDDRVRGLDAGADDYLIKPFALEELEARIRVLLRRRAGRAEAEIAHGALRINPATHQLNYKNKQFILSAKEFALLSALLEKPGAVQSRAQLEERLYGWNEEVESNAVEVHIHNLRKKLGNEIIRNIRGVGYVIGDAA